MVSKSATVTEILSTRIHEPADALLVVLVVLTLNDDFLEAVDELVTALLREVLVLEEVFRAVEVLVRLLPVLWRYTSGELILSAEQSQYLTHICASDMDIQTFRSLTLFWKRVFVLTSVFSS